MCYWDRNVGRNFRKFKLWKRVDAKKPLLHQWDFRVPRRDQSVLKD